MLLTMQASSPQCDSALSRFGLQVISPRLGFAVMQSAVRNWRMAHSTDMLQLQKDRIRRPLIELHKVLLLGAAGCCWVLPVALTWAALGESATEAGL